MSRRYITVKFADGSTRDYCMPDVSHMPWGPDFIEECKTVLLKRLNKLGKFAGTPGTDLRHFNGNFATGRGRNPGPKPVEIIKEWSA